MNSHQFIVPDMSCANCVAHITQAIHELEAAAKVSIDLASKRVEVQSESDAQAIVAALDEAGYTAQTQ